MEEEQFMAIVRILPVWWGRLQPAPLLNGEHHGITGRAPNRDDYWNRWTDANAIWYLNVDLHRALHQTWRDTRVVDRRRYSADRRSHRQREPRQRIDCQRAPTGPIQRHDGPHRRRIRRTIHRAVLIERRRLPLPARVRGEDRRDGVRYVQAHRSR